MFEGLRREKGEVEVKVSFLELVLVVRWEEVGSVGKIDRRGRFKGFGKGVRNEDVL